MAHNDIEIEIQTKVETLELLLKFLEANAKFASEKHQIDEYFTPPHKDFLASRPAKEWLRVRYADNKSTLNYKNWHHGEDGKSHHCDELETELGSAVTAKKLLKALDFKTIVIVDKVRKAWTYEDYEVAVDSVKGLGDFVEVEYIGSDDKADPDKIASEMITFLKNTGCGEVSINYVGYPFMMLFPEEVKFDTH
jgi:adenylate cyclase class 2